MSKQKKWVSKLRFPEFRDAALRSVLLGDVTEEGRSRNGHKHLVASVMGVTKSDGIVPMEARLIAADIARYKLVQNDWFAYNPMRLNIGSIARWKGESEILVSPDYVVFKCLTENKSGIDPAYLDHFRQTKAWEDFVTEGGDGGVRVRIYYKDIARLQLALPALPEQQKIAECLSSVGELIAAEARKLDALKTHKKGLMQQLFPRICETQPRLRFPEFRDAGEWEVDELGTVAAFVNEKIPVEQIALENYVSTENILPDYGRVARASKLPTTGSVTRFKPNDTLVSNIRPYLKKVWVADKEGGASNDVIVIRSKQRLLPQYFSCLLKNDAFIDYVMTGAKGVKMPRGDVASMKAYPAPYPSKPEQQKIADCLSSLDDLIAAQTQKLEALKTHKKGLMQQLFPSPVEVEA